MTLRKMIWLLMNSEKKLDDEVRVRILHRGGENALTYVEVVTVSWVTASGDVNVEASSLKREG